MLLIPLQEEKLNMELSYFVLLHYPVTPLNTDTAWKSERLLTQKCKHLY